MFCGDPLQWRNPYRRADPEQVQESELVAQVSLEATMRRAKELSGNSIKIAVKQL